MFRTCFIAVCFVVLACGPEANVQEISSGELSLSSPAPGAWLEEASFRVAGLAKGFEQVNVNGVMVDVHDGEYETDVLAIRGVNLVEVSGVDQRGDTHFVRHGLLAGNFKAPGQPLEDAVHLRVNTLGLEAAASLVGEYLRPEEMAEQALSMNPVYQDSYGFWNWEAVTVSADLEAVHFEMPQLNLIPRDGYLFIEAVIPDLTVDVAVYGEVAGIDYDQPVWMSADTVVLTAEAILGAKNGHLFADLGEATLIFENFFMDTALIPGEIEQALLGDTIQEKLETMIIEQMQNSVPALLEETLSQLDLSHEMDLMGHAVALDASFSVAGVDSQGVFAEMDVQMSIPSQTDRFYRGYLAADQDVRPEMNYASGLYASLSDDLINRALFEAWRGGMMQYAVGTADGSLPPAALSHFQAEEGTVSIDALLPPVLIQGNGSLSLQAAEVQVKVQTPGGGMGDFLEASLTIFADVEMTATAGVMTLELGELDLHIMVTDSDWGATEEAITRVLEENLPLDALLSLVQDFEVPIPSFSGVEVSTIDLQRDGGGMHTNVAVNLK